MRAGSITPTPVKLWSLISPQSWLKDVLFSSAMQSLDANVPFERLEVDVGPRQSRQRRVNCNSPEWIDVQSSTKEAGESSWSSRQRIKCERSQTPKSAKSAHAESSVRSSFSTATALCYAVRCVCWPIYLLYYTCRGAGFEPSKTFSKRFSKYTSYMTFNFSVDSPAFRLHFDVQPT